MQSQPLRAWKLGLTTSHGSQVLSFTYDMDAYVATFLEVGLRTCVESWVEQKARTNLNTIPYDFLNKIIKV